jgi:hypothetical protein
MLKRARTRWAYCAADGGETLPLRESSGGPAATFPRIFAAGRFQTRPEATINPPEF